MGIENCSVQSADLLYLARTLVSSAVHVPTQLPVVLPQGAAVVDPCVQ